MNITLTRFAYLPECTLGTLYVGALKLATIERPWIPNPAGRGGMLKVSCVPDGLYTLLPYSSPKFPDNYLLLNEALGVYRDLPEDRKSGRDTILIHQGVWVRHVIGCIAVGLTHGTQTNEASLTDSAIAMSKLRAVLGHGSHLLEIKPTVGTQELAA